MNTVWHLFWTYALFREKKWVGLALLMAIIPDMPWFISNVVAYSMNGFGPGTFELAWENPYVLVAASFMNSFVVIGVIYLIVRLANLASLLPLVYGWVLHVVLDFFTHNTDAYPAFYPLSSWKFHSPISYWESSHHSQVFSVINLILVGLFVIYLIREKKKLSPQTKKNDIVVSSLAILGLFGSFLAIMHWVSSHEGMSTVVIWFFSLHAVPILLFILLIIKRKKGRLHFSKG